MLFGDLKRHKPAEIEKPDRSSLEYLVKGKQEEPSPPPEVNMGKEAADAAGKAAIGAESDIQAPAASTLDKQKVIGFNVGQAA